jgi:hypothetical protein
LGDRRRRAVNFRAGERRDGRQIRRNDTGYEECRNHTRAAVFQKSLQLATRAHGGYEVAVIDSMCTTMLRR